VHRAELRRDVRYPSEYIVQAGVFPASSRGGVGGEGLAVCEREWASCFLEHGIGDVGNERECCDGSGGGVSL